MATIQAYKKAFNNCSQRMGKLSQRNMDRKLVEYLETISPAARRPVAEKLLSAVKHFFPREASSLPIATRFLHQIKRESISTTKPPMVEDVVIMVVTELVMMGYPTTALGVYIQFDAYLRPSELCAVKANHVLVSGDSVLGNMPPKVLIILPVTKTGFLQSVDLRIPLLQHILTKLVSVVPSSKLLFPNYSLYAKRMHMALHRLKLAHIGYTPHSVRHGAATMDLIKGGYNQLPAILYRGRWESTIGKKYIQMGAALLLDAKLPRHFVTRARVARQWLDNTLRGASFTPGQ